MCYVMYQWGKRTEQDLYPGTPLKLSWVPFSLVDENAHSAKASETYLSKNPAQSLPHWNQKETKPRPSAMATNHQWWFTTMAHQQQATKPKQHGINVDVKQNGGPKWWMTNNNWINTQLNQLPTGPRDQVSNHQNNSESYKILTRFNFSYRLMFLNSFDVSGTQTLTLSPPLKRMTPNST